MWKTFTVSNNTYMLKVVEANENFNIYVSDLIDIWHDKYTKEKIVHNFQESNPTIDVKPDTVILQVLKIFNEINEAEVTINRTENEIDLFIKTETSGFDVKFKIKYKLNLTIRDKKQFIEKVTAPMIHTINCLEKQQNMLCDLIQKKDRELEEYKMEKGLISRTDLITEKFDPNTIEKSNENLLLNVFDESSKFWESFVNEYGNVEKKVAVVTVEPWNHVKRKRKIYNAKTAAKKFSKSIIKHQDETDS